MEGEWISVKDRLLEVDNTGCVEVLGFSNHCIDVISFINDYGQEKWYFDGYNKFIEITGVTHWMPLPDPPKQ